MPMQLVLVEDDELVREVLLGILDARGIMPRSFETAEELLADNAALTTKPDVLLTNINLGAGMTGFALAETLRRTWPDLPVLYISGRVQAPPHTINDRTGWLDKPFGISALVSELERLTNPHAD